MIDVQMRRTHLVILASILCAPVARADDGGRIRWQKGQTHAHSNRSGDSNTPPELVARWYASHGFDFLVFTDHNSITELLPSREWKDMLVIGGVEMTQNLPTCEPPPPAGMMCLLHINSLFVRAQDIPWPPEPPHRRLDLYQRELDANRAIGGLAQLNHPNFHFGADASLMAELVRRGVVFVEIANRAGDSFNQGDATHPPVEALWDATLSAGLTSWGVATDDAHHYYDAQARRARGRDVYTGDRGFVMVRARHEIAAIRDAMARGDFYSTSGLLLEDVRVEEGELRIDVKAPAAPIVTTFIGARGKVLARATGPHPRYRLSDAPPAPHAYVRAVITDGKDRTAWTQPVRVPKQR